MSDKKFFVEDTRVVHQGAIVRLEEMSIRTPDGDLITREAVRHPGAVAVVAVHEGSVVLVEQYRAALDDNLIEIPAGKKDIVGESGETAARRELIEEVGLDPQTLIYLGDFVTAAGFCDEVLSIYASNDCVEVGRQVDGVEEEHSTILRVPLGDIDDWLASNRLSDAKSLIGLFWARDRGLLAPTS